MKFQPRDVSARVWSHFHKCCHQRDIRTTIFCGVWHWMGQYLFRTAVKLIVDLEWNFFNSFWSIGTTGLSLLGMHSWSFISKISRANLAAVLVSEFNNLFSTKKSASNGINKLSISSKTEHIIICTFSRKSNTCRMWVSIKDELARNNIITHWTWGCGLTIRAYRWSRSRESWCAMPTSRFAYFFTRVIPNFRNWTSENTFTLSAR